MRFSFGSLWSYTFSRTINSSGWPCAEEVSADHRYTSSEQAPWSTQASNKLWLWLNVTHNHLETDNISSNTPFQRSWVALWAEYMVIHKLAAQGRTEVQGHGGIHRMISLASGWTCLLKRSLQCSFICTSGEHNCDCCQPFFCSFSMGTGRAPAQRPMRPPAVNG